MIRLTQIMSAALLLLLALGVQAQEQIDGQMEVNEAQPGSEMIDIAAPEVSEMPKVVEDLEAAKATEVPEVVEAPVAVETPVAVEEPKAAEEKVVEAVAVPAAEPVEQVVEPVGKDAAVEDYPVTLNFNETDLLVVLNTLAELRPNTSVVIDPGVSGAVTINIKQVPWLKALELILKPRGLKYELEGENIYHIQLSGQAEQPATVDENYNENLVVILYTADEINALSDAQVRKLYGYKPGDAPITEEQIKEKLIASEVPFIKKLKVREQPTSNVLHTIAQAGELNYSLAKPDPKPVNPDAPNQPPPFQEVDISIALKMIGLEDALAMIAARGGYACFYKKGIWEIAPNAGAVQKPLIMEHFEVEYLEVGNELIAALKSSLTPLGSIIPGMNKVLIVKDTEDGIEQVRRTIQAMDKPTPQVLIEARFFEITTNDGQKVGFDWEKIFGTNGLVVEGNSYTFSNSNGNFAIDSGNDIGGTAVSANAAVFKTAKLNTVLRMLKNETSAEQLSNPKIVVASDKQATVHIGAQEPIIDAQVTVSDGETTISYSLNEKFGGTQKEATALLDNPPPANGTRVMSGYLDLGTKLTVAPSVKTDEDIYLKVLPELITKVRDIPLTLGDGITVNYPEINVTSVYSEFSLKSGQTVAIGGLVKEEENIDIDKIPVLGEIPLLGKLFTHSSTEIVRAETIIFLTVKIVGAEELKEISGVPVHSELTQPTIDEVRKHDSNGAEYIDIEEKEPEDRILPDWAWNMYMDFE